MGLLLQLFIFNFFLTINLQSPNLAHYSSYKESALLPTANLMLNYILKPIKHESFHKKYAGKRYYKVCYLPSAKRIFFDKIPLVERVYARVGS